jgi:hypothetical protein
MYVTQKTDISWHKLIIALTFKVNAFLFVRRELVKIAENSDQNLCPNNANILLKQLNFKQTLKGYMERFELA